MKQANLYCDSKTVKFIENQAKTIIKTYVTFIDNHQFDELYEKLSSDDEILGGSISRFTTHINLLPFDVLIYLHNIPDYFLTYTDIQSYRIPDGFEKIGEEAFRDCRDLITITIPTSLREIKRNAFKNCANLKAIFYNGTQAEFDRLVVSEGNDEFKKAQVQFI